MRFTWIFAFWQRITMFSVEIFLFNITIVDTTLFFKKQSKWYTVNSLYLERPLSWTSLYIKLKFMFLCIGCNLLFSLYLELSLSRTNSMVPSEFDVERANCIDLVVSMLFSIKKVHFYLCKSPTSCSFISRLTYSYFVF